MRIKTIAAVILLPCFAGSTDVLAQSYAPTGLFGDDSVIRSPETESPPVPSLC